MEPWGTWCQVSGRCPKPPRKLYWQDPVRFSSCWGTTKNSNKKPSTSRKKMTLTAKESSCLIPSALPPLRVLLCSRQWGLTKWLPAPQCQAGTGGLVNKKNMFLHHQPKFLKQEPRLEKTHIVIYMHFWMQFNLESLHFL